MKKVIVSSVLAMTLLGAISPASAHGGRGGYGGGWRSGWGPFALGAVTGAVIASSYYRPAPIYVDPPVYYGPPPDLYAPQRAAAYCPENGLYYPQTEVCPSGWRRVIR